MSGSAVLIVDAGHGHRISLGVARCLSSVPGTRLHVLSNTPAAQVRWSRHVRSFDVAPSVDDEGQWLAAVESLADAHSIDVLLAVSEPGVGFLARHRERLERSAIVAPVPPIDSFEVAVNKARYTAFVASHGFGVPASVTVQPDHLADGSLAERISHLGGPLLLKRSRSSSGFGIERFDSPEALLAHLRVLDAIEDDAFLVQEVVRGNDVCCTVLCDDGEIVAHATYHGLVDVKAFQPWHCAAFVVDDEAMEQTARIVALLSWSGPANVDFLRTEDGGLSSIEFNGRYDGHVSGAVRTGINFPDLHLRLARGLSVEQPAYEPTLYLDHRGLIHQLRARVRREPHLEFGYHNTSMPETVRDPLPDAMQALTMAASRLPTSVRGIGRSWRSARRG